MASRALTLVDYGMGNLRSLARALERAGGQVLVTEQAHEVDRAERLVIPGQGAFGQAMERLAERGLVEPIQRHLARGRPLLGVCLGLQLLYAGSAEAPGVAGLALLTGRVEILPVGPGLKRPHMGWAPVEHDGAHPVLSANPAGAAYYFVHSYAARDAQDFSAAYCTHGARFVAALARGPVLATQFHPEKSQDAGDRLLRAWLAA